jgi:thioredoxin-like negative regulator of GroEL
MPIIHVRNVNSREKYNRLLKKVPCITLFYADWCGHCQQFKPEWRKFEKLIRDSDVNNEILIATVGEKERKSVDGDSDVLGYPTVFYLMNGKKQKEYTGPRSSDGLLEFLKSIRPDLREKIKDEQSIKLIQMGGKRKNNTHKRKTHKRKIHKRKTHKSKKHK